MTPKITDGHKLLAHNLRRWRELRGIETEALANSLGWPLAMIEDIEAAERFSDYVETTCTASNVRRDGDRVLFTAQCITDDFVETVEGGYTYISPDAFHFRGQTLTRCDATLASAPDDGFAASTEEIIDLWSGANSSCRGGSGDDPRTMGACGAREEYDAILQGRGWCYGRPDDAGYQRAWQRCN